MKGKIHNLQIFFLGLLGLYPLIKFDWSSKIIAIFCALSITIAITNKRIHFTRENCTRFIAMTSYFFLLFFSTIYSSNNEEALLNIAQIIPLLIIPFIISFVNFKISQKNKTSIFQLFIAVNIIYTFVIMYLFINSPDRLILGIQYYLLDYDKFQFITNQNPLGSFVLVHKAYFSMGFVMCALFALYAFLKNSLKSKSLRVVYFFVFIYFSLWIFFAFSFPNVLALILSVLLMLKLELKKKSFLIAVISFVIFCGVFLTIKSNDVDFQRGINFIKSASTGKEYNVKETRGEIYKAVFGIVKKSSFSEFLFGFGFGDVQERLNKEYQNRLLQNKSRNILYYSEEISDNYWFKNNIKVLGNKGVSPEGKKNADLMIGENLKERRSHNISANINNEDKGRYTLSVFVKKDQSNLVTLRLGTINQRATFDLSDGKLFKKEDVFKADIIALKNNWYRCFIVVDEYKSGLVLFGLSDDKGAYVYKTPNTQSMFFWGLQLEKGNLTTYLDNKNGQLQIAINEELNTHNNYIYLFLAAGFLGLLSFLFFIAYLFKISLFPLDIFKVSFCILVGLNFLTENILSRHWGLMFFSFMIVLLFNKEEKV